MKELFSKFRWLILFSVISPFVFYLLIITPSNIGFVKAEDTGAWLGYYGAILASIIAIAGIKWSIDVQKKQLNEQNKRLEDIRIEDNKKRDRERKEELAIQYKPILKFKNSKVKQIAELMEFEIIFENVGRGEAIDVEYLPISVPREHNHILAKFNDDIEIIPKNRTYIIKEVFLAIDTSKPYSIEKDNFKIGGLLEIKETKHKFNSEIIYRNPIDKNIKYTIQFNYELDKVVAKNAYSKIKSITDKDYNVKYEWQLNVLDTKYIEIIENDK